MQNINFNPRITDGLNRDHLDGATFPVCMLMVVNRRRRLISVKSADYLSAILPELYFMH